VRCGGGGGGGREPSPGEIDTVYPIDLVPLPVWDGLDAAARLLRVRNLIAEIETAAQSRYETVPGAAWVRARNPTSKLPRTRPRFAPRIHTASDDVRSDFTSAELAFLDGFGTAKQQLRRGRIARLPGGCFPPVPPFRVASSAIAITESSENRTSSSQTSSD
jgi:hypothetical protein